MYSIFFDLQKIYIIRFVDNTDARNWIKFGHPVTLSNAVRISHTLMERRRLACDAGAKNFQNWCTQCETAGDEVKAQNSGMWNHHHLQEATCGKQIQFYHHFSESFGGA